LEVIGKFFLVANGLSRIEKALDGHKGAVLAVRWSFDGTAFATGTMVFGYKSFYIFFRWGGWDSEDMVEIRNVEVLFSPKQ
jgi:hypothetical protein